jgi:prepilin-type N-terminal cleavage/methylation domain-containing protein
MARRDAFSLLELVIVVVILGILASIAVARYPVLADNAKWSSAQRTYSAFETALRMYHADHGGFPPDTNAGARIIFLDEYLKLPGLGSRPAPFGGYWDWNNSDVPFWAGTSASMTIHWPAGAVPNAELLAYDRWADDGSLATGVYRRFKSNRFYGIAITP